MAPHQQEALKLVASIRTNILNPLIMLLMAIALLVFLWGGYQFIANADNDQARAVGKRHMLYGFIGFLIMVSAYGILSVALNTFGIAVPTP